MSDTPETNAASFDSGFGYWAVPEDFARKLERERNALRNLLAESHDIISCLANATTPTALAWLKQYQSYRKP